MHNAIVNDCSVNDSAKLVFIFYGISPAPIAIHPKLHYHEHNSIDRSVALTAWVN